MGSLRLRDSGKILADLVAVDGISFSVRKGEIFGFLGPNGAGKTTTMKMIACVSPRTSGTLQVFGMDPDIQPAEIKQRLGVVPQETNLDPDFTCFGNLFTYSGYFDIPYRYCTEKVRRTAGVCPAAGETKY